jgi:biopolymer transport protein ExbD
MAFGGSGGTRKLKSDINVTPMVDVVLVLLIIFIVVTPVVMRQITIEIPRKLDDEQMQEVVQERQLVVELKDSGELLLDEQSIAQTELASKLNEKLASKRDYVLFVSFGDEVKYGDVMKVMDTCKGVLRGITKCSPDEEKLSSPRCGTIALRMKEKKDDSEAPK